MQTIQPKCVPIPGITWDADNGYLYTAISTVERGMEDNKDTGKADKKRDIGEFRSQARHHRGRYLPMMLGCLPLICVCPSLYVHEKTPHALINAQVVPTT
jgi:hypothetical protein